MSRAVSLMAALLLLSPAWPARAQEGEGPTPFWMPAEPEAPKNEPPRKKKGTKVKPAKKKTRTPRAQEDDPPPPAQASQRRTLPPIPTLQPEPPRAPQVLMPERAPQVLVPERAPPVLVPERAPQVLVPERTPQLVPERAPQREPVREPPVPRVEEPAAISRRPEPLPAPPAVAEPPAVTEPALARWSADAAIGLWGKARADGGARSNDFAYGLDLGFAAQPWLLVDVLVLRAGGEAGNPFASATATHTLFSARLFYVWSRGPFSLLGGAGLGGVLSQTHYALDDVGADPQSLDAAALRTALQATAGARFRPFRGLEARLEVSGLLRDGRVELLPIFSLGGAF